MANQNQTNKKTFTSSNPVDCIDLSTLIKCLLFLSFFDLNQLMLLNMEAK